MLEKFNLWEYSDLNHPGTIEATKSLHHGFGSETVDGIGYVELDIKDIRLSSGGLPILLLKLFGELERKCISNSEKSKAKIHMVSINKLPFGYLVGEKDELELQNGIIILNGKQKEPLDANERKVLDSLYILRLDNQLKLGYDGVRGEVEAHNSTLCPKDINEYCFSNVCIRDYFSF